MTSILFLAVSCLQPAAFAASAPSPSGGYRIAGIVVNATSDEPVPRAVVAVLTEADSQTVASTVTDSDGHFALDHLAAAKYQLTASKRGFRTAFYDEHEAYSSAIVTGEGQDTENLRFRLSPGAILRGVVTGDGGDPVEGAQVMLFARSHAGSPANRTRQIASTITNDLGGYEFGNLAAGEYLLAARAEPWYADHGSPRPAQKAEKANAALDVVYPVTYYDSTTDEPSAATIALSDGSRVEANLSLHAVPAIHLTVQVPRRANGGYFPPQLQQSVLGVEMPASATQRMGAQNGDVFEFTGVAPGHYELTQGDPPRTVLLDASSNQQIDPAAGTPNTPVTATLKIANGYESANPQPGEFILVLESVDGPRRFVNLPIGAHGTDTNQQTIPPGNWRVWANAQGRQWQVLALAVNGRARPGSTFAVGDKPVTLVVTVTQGAARVEGFARKEGRGFAGAMIVLFPADAVGSRAGFETLIRRDQSDSDGSFALRDVVPGDYFIVAIEDGWTLDWASPEVLSRYLAGGVAVSVKDARAVRLAGPVAVQPRD